MGLTPRSTAMVLCGLLVLATGLTFGPGLFGRFVRDDGPLIANNQDVRGDQFVAELLTTPFWDVSGAKLPRNPAYAGISRPLVKLAYRLEFQVFGASPFGYHVVNLLLHLACIALAVVWLRRRLGRPPGSYGWVAAVIGATVFALHPSRPESVSWISGSTDVWMTFWTLLGLLALDLESRWLAIGCASVAFALAVWSKEVAILVPLALGADALLLPFLTHRLRRPLVAAVAGGLALSAQLYFVVLKPSGGWLAQGVPDFFERVPATLGRYVAETLLPAPRIHLGYLWRDSSDHIVYATWAVALGVVAFVALAGLVVLAWRRPTARPWVADLAWWIVPLLPVLNVVPRGGGGLICDRFLYMPMLGVAALLTRASARLAERWPNRFIMLAAGALLVVLAARSLPRVADFRSNAALWGAELEKDPDDVLAIESLADLAVSQHRFDAALRLDERGYRTARAQHAYDAEIEFALAAIMAVESTTSDADQASLRKIRDSYERFERTGKLTLALPRLKLAISPAKDVWKTIMKAHAHLGLARATAWLRTGQLDVAVRLLQRVVANQPRSAPPWGLLMLAYARGGNFALAAQAGTKALARLPDEPSLVAVRATVARAREIASQPATDPVDRACRDAAVQRALGAPEAARKILNPLLAQHPTDPRLVLERTRADVADLRFDMARADLERALAADPANANRWHAALANLAKAERAHARRAPGPMSAPVGPGR